MRDLEIKRAYTDISDVISLNIEESNFVNNGIFLFMPDEGSHKPRRHGIHLEKNQAQELRDYLNEFLGECAEKENYHIVVSLCRENLNLRKQLKDAEELRVKNEAILDRLRIENSDLNAYIKKQKEWILDIRHRVIGFDWDLIIDR